jgi:hypothetical protein
MELFIAAGTVYLGYCVAKWAVTWLPGAIWACLKIGVFLGFVTIVYGFLQLQGLIV